MRNNEKGMRPTRIWILALCLILLPSVACAVKSPVVPSAEADSTPAKVLEKLLHEPFTFGIGKHSDPFVPFVSEQMIKSQSDAEVKSLSGMQLFEPGQLDLVAILFSGRQALAMVQDSTGKGYIIKKGTMIGRRGKVAEIMPNAVVIKEWFMNSSGKKLYKDNEMVLRKEGGNK